MLQTQVFVYKSVELAIYRGAEVLDITVVPRKNGLAICSGYHKPAPGEVVIVFRTHKLG